MMAGSDLVVIHEHPEWQEPLFAALKRRGVSFAAFDLKSACYLDDEIPAARLYFNQASPSAYVRGHTRAVPLNLALLRHLERRGAHVLNGADVFALELSKAAQHALLRSLAIDCPRSAVFNDPRALARHPALQDGWRWPALLKPDQGGSGARIAVVEGVEDVIARLDADPALWLPDNLFLLQELCEHDPARGIVRLELLGGELLYAMRVVTHGRFNLCPAPMCNPEDGGDSACAIPQTPENPVEFYPYAEVPAEAVQTARRIARAAGIDVGGIEYLETPDGRRVFYDINANSNLRPSIAQAFGFDPFERVVDFLEARLRTVDRPA
jgi:glutathione synthase/RimK-type ligase-like ATP-grasp enzyme